MTGPRLRPSGEVSKTESVVGFEVGLMVVAKHLDGQSPVVQVGNSKRFLAGLDGESHHEEAHQQCPERVCRRCPEGEMSQQKDGRE